MTILSWNVNGIRARLKAGLLDTIKEIDADIMCLQETRAARDQMPEIEGYSLYHSEHEKKGYAGVATYVKAEYKPWLAEYVFYHAVYLEQGRVCITYHKNFTLINSYSPNIGMNLEKAEKRQEFQNALYQYMTRDEKPVILCGDLNVAPEERDNKSKLLAGNSELERKEMAKIFAAGYTDVWRAKHRFQDEITGIIKQRYLGRGQRLDLFVVDNGLLPKVKTCVIKNDEKLLAGSDHKPIVLNMEEIDNDN